MTVIIKTQKGNKIMADTIRPNKTGRRWDKVDLMNFYGSVALGNGTQYHIATTTIIMFGIKWLVVFLKGASSNNAIFGADLIVRPEEINKKLKLQFISDAENLSDFFNFQLFCDYIEVGSYNDNFLKDEPKKYE